MDTNMPDQPAPLNFLDGEMKEIFDDLKEIRRKAPAIRGFARNRLRVEISDLQDVFGGPISKPLKAPDGNPWPWGTIVAIHEIGNLSIVESAQESEGKKEVKFYPFLDGKRSGGYLNSLDQAVIFGLASKYEGYICHGAGRYICKMIGLPLEED